MPRVTVITPCYNNSRHIGATIESLRRQTFSSWEHIIIDDGSSDESAAFIASFQQADGQPYLFRQPNKGVSNARNNGYRHASPDSEYLLFLDADDVLLPTMLERLVRYLDEHPDAGMVFCEPEIIGTDGEILPRQWQITRYMPGGFLGARRIPRDECETPFVSMYAMPAIVPCMCLIRRSTYLQTTGWDESIISPCEDTDLFLQIALLTPLHYLPEKLVQYRRHASQVTSDTERLERQITLLYEKWQHLPGLSAEQQQMVQDAHHFMRFDFAFRVCLLTGIQHLRQGQVRPAIQMFGKALRRKYQGRSAL